MSKVSNDPARYWRTGIALAMSRKPEFERRLNELGLKTLGDLALLFTLSDTDIISALKPFADKYNEDRHSQPSSVKVLDVAKKLKGLTPEQLERMLALATEQEMAQK